MGSEAVSTGHVGDWCQVYSGRAFYPLDPREDEIDIIDIAHALSMQCRYGGHAKRFYSVAEHCIHLSYAVDPIMAAEALMHDAAEAYIVDVPRPIKKSLVGYLDIERGLELVISKRFDLVYPWPKKVMDMDTNILTDGRQQLMSVAPMPWGTDMEPLGVTIQFWSPEYAEELFLERAFELGIS